MDSALTPFRRAARTTAAYERSNTRRSASQITPAARSNRAPFGRVPSRLAIFASIELGGRRNNSDSNWMGSGADAFVELPKRR